MTAEDVDDVVALVVRADALTADWAPDGWRLPDGHAERERAVWVKELANDDFRAEVAIGASGTILGVVATKRDNHISTLFVEPSEHGRGIGGELLARAEEWLRADGVELATLNVLEGAPAVDFYETRGWSPTGVRDHFEWFDLPTVRYAKAL